MSRIAAPRAPGCASAVLLGATLPAAALIVVWLVGDQSFRGPVKGGLDRMVQPLPWLERDAALLGSVGVAVLLTGVALSARRRRRWRVLLPLIGAGALLGLLYRTVTAGVIGANIGGGLAVMVLGPLVLVLLVVAAVQARAVFLDIVGRQQRLNAARAWAREPDRPGDAAPASTTA